MMAIRLPDLLLGSSVSMSADNALYPGDMFDDLVIRGTSGVTARVQVKHHSQEPDRPLPLSSFTTDSRSLRLDKLVACVKEERRRRQNREGAQLRIVFRDRAPTDQRLARILRPPVRDPGPFTSGMQTTRFTFSPEAIWQWSLQADSPRALDFLRDESSTLADLEALRDLVVIEVGAPTASLNLSDPGPAEQLLVERIRADIGIGCYPNAERSSVDVAAQLLAHSVSARVTGNPLTADSLARQIGLRTDLGAVARAHPVIVSREVSRPNTVREFITTAEHAARGGLPMVVEAPPGHGKSWFCKQLSEALTAEGWMVAQHYCFLGQADQEIQRRVSTPTIFGSLLSRLEEADASLLEQQRPRFAANEDTLVRGVEEAVKQYGKVALIIDGLDHVTRVIGRTVNQTEPARLLAESLAQLPLPNGATLVLLSQRGEHLGPFRQRGARFVDLPGLDHSELANLASRMGVPAHPGFEAASWPSDDFVAALEAQSAGNGLYATYICRELLRDPGICNPIDVVSSLPPFDGTLHNYYEHLLSALDSGARRTAGLLALLPFSVTRSEIGQIQPAATRHVSVAVDQLSCVLEEVAAQGGLRIYHESFSRFIRESMLDDSEIRAAILRDIVNWLESRGFLEDDRAFRYLLPLLAAAGELRRVTSRIGVDFVAHAVAAGFTPQAIVANLATGVSAAAAQQDWPAVVRCVELARGAATYEFERLDSVLVEFIDVPLALLGPDVFTNRLLFDGRPTVPPRAGLFLCDQLDRRGESAPWSEYLHAYEVWRKTDRTSYDSASNLQFQLAALRGQLRLKSNVDIVRLARSLAAIDFPHREVVNAIVDTCGSEAMATVIDHSTDPGGYHLAMAERCRDEGDSSGRVTWTDAAVTTGVPTGQLHRLFALDVPVESISWPQVEPDRARLLELADAVQDSKIHLESTPISEWLDVCAVAARRDPFGLATAEAALDGSSWYGCWLRFTVAMCRAEVAARNERSAQAIEALRILTEVSDPFAGKPRACDLYGIHDIIDATLSRILRLVDDASWPTAVSLIRTTSQQMSVTIWGELGGPVPSDKVAELIIDNTTVDRLNDSREAVAEIVEGSGGYYWDVARFNCLAARLALRGCEPDTARKRWKNACEALVAYGGRKDDTVSELLEPFQDLIERDQREARRRLPGLGELCERVIERTDGKGTHWVLDAWCGLLAKADPSGMMQVAAPHLLENCNLPSSTLTGALNDLWEEHQNQVPPHIAGALRLAISPGQRRGDARLLHRLVRPPESTGVPPGDLIRLLIARADERPVSYDVTNSEDLVRRDEKTLAELNELALAAHQPRIVPRAIKRRQQSAADRTDLGRSRSHYGSETEELECFASGAPGIRQAIATWKRRSIGTESLERARFANALGFRLLELLIERRDGDAETLIRSLADSPGFETGPLLGDLAEGLERHGQTRLAVVCHTLAWTRTRGGGGWMTFGGEDLLRNLRSAARLDEAATLNLLAEEVTRLVGVDGYGRYGITRALIWAMNRVDWPSFDETDAPTRVPFQMWDEAYAVIRSRLPHYGRPQEPWLPYTPTTVLRLAPVDAWKRHDDKDYDWEAAFAMTVASMIIMSSAAREDKRRSLLAVKLLLAEEPDLMGLVLERTLRHFSDPTTVTWLLLMLLDAGESARSVVAGCSGALHDLASSPSFLLVRAAAARLLSAHGIKPPSPPVGDDGRIWVGDEEYADEREHIKALLVELGGDRITKAEAVVPGFRATITKAFAEAVDSDEFKRRGRSQLRSLGDPDGKIWPDAFICEEEKFEEIVQSCASTARAWLARKGSILTAPLEWEFQLARRLSLSPAVSLALEHARIPRPRIPSPPSAESSLWQQIRGSLTCDECEVVSGVLGATEDANGHLTATVRVVPCERIPRVSEGPYESWWIVASYEMRRGIRDRSDATQALNQKLCAVEYRDAEDISEFDQPPFLQGDTRLWAGSNSDQFRHVFGGRAGPRGPLVGLDTQSRVIRTGVTQLGPAGPILTPSPHLVHAANLEPAQSLKMDRAGDLALVLETWRAAYDMGDYRPKRPLLAGSWLLMSPTAFAQLRTHYDSQLVWREFVAGTGIGETD